MLPPPPTTAPPRPQCGWLAQVLQAHHSGSVIAANLCVALDVMEAEEASFEEWLRTTQLQQKRQEQRDQLQREQELQQQQSEQLQRHLSASLFKPAALQIPDTACPPTAGHGPGDGPARSSGEQAEDSGLPCQPGRSCEAPEGVLTRQPAVLLVQSPQVACSSATADLSAGTAAEAQGIATEPHASQGQSAETGNGDVTGAASVGQRSPTLGRQQPHPSLSGAVNAVLGQRLMRLLPAAGPALTSATTAAPADGQVNHPPPGPLAPGSRRNKRRTEIEYTAWQPTGMCASDLHSQRCAALQHFRAPQPTGAAASTALMAWLLTLYPHSTPFSHPLTLNPPLLLPLQAR